MCFVSLVKARFLALLLVLVAVLGQQRVVTPATHASTAAVARLVSERAELIQSNALRSEVASRLSPAPVLARPPSLPVVIPEARVRSLDEPSSALEPLRRPGEVARHFHSKRRIPRMNSEEPPRA